MFLYEVEFQFLHFIQSRKVVELRQLYPHSFYTFLIRFAINGCTFTFLDSSNDVLLVF